MSSSLIVQEDRFDDGDDISDFGSDYSFGDAADVAEDEGLVNRRSDGDVRLNGRLSTIAEESATFVDVTRNANKNEPVFDQKLTSDADFIDSGEFVKASETFFQKGEESFKKKQFMKSDDARFNVSHFEKENSWEPSVISSPAPPPDVTCDDDPKCKSLIALEPISENQNKDRNTAGKSEVPKTIQKTPPNEKDIGANNGPMFSTPNSYIASTSQRPALFDLSNDFNGISIISSRSPSIRADNGRDFLNKGNLSVDDGDVSNLTQGQLDAILTNTSQMDNTLLAQILMRAKNERRARRQNRQISFTFNKPILCQSAYSAGKSDVMKRNTVARCGGDKEERSMVNSLENSVFQKTNRVPSSHQHLDLFGSEQKPCRSNSIHADLTPKVIDKPSVNLQQKQSDAQLPFCPSGAVSLQSAHSSISANNKQNWTHSSSTFSVASSSRTASSQLHRNNVLTCSVRCLYFGFVELKERAYRSVKLHNISQEKLSLKIFVRSKGKGFELSEDGLVVINAGERHVIRVIFEPKIAARYLNDLKISVLNAEHLSYTIPIFGGGGVASLRLISERNLDIARDGSYVLSTSNSACFTFEALNNGIRDAFIFVMVIDNETDKVVETVHVEPSDAVVLIHRRKQKFVVSISIDEDDHRKRANSVASVRSTDSCPTQTLSRSSSCRYRVLLLWGEEAQRRRLQKYELLHNKNFLFLERTLTKIAFVHEEEARCPNPRATDYAVGPYDYDVFNESLRRTCISVVNNRLSFSTSNVSVRDATLSEFALQPDATILPTYEKTVLIDVTHDYDSRRH